MTRRLSITCDLDRRRFLEAAALLGAAGAMKCRATAFFPTSPAAASKPIADLELDLNGIHKWDDSNGDTWDPFWADDDRLYSFNCDGRGFGKVGQNLAFNRFDGQSLESLTGLQINAMAEYGPGGQHGKDNATWKACGQECIDGVFYAFVSRNTYGSESHDPLMRQTAVNSNLIKSVDRGRTWHRTAAENYDRPMWPGPKFGAPFFVHYGKNGGSVDRDGAREFVYAVSTNGFWNDGDSLTLGRVKRRALAALDASQWEYFIGGDGMRAASWSKSINAARPILERPAKCGQTAICFVPALGLYLLISWYNPVVLKKWYEPSRMCYDFYQAEHPWGPWSLVRSFSDDFIAAGSHMYGPALCPKYQEASGGEVRLAMFTSGCQFDDVPSSVYKVWVIPVVLRTERLPASTVRTAASSDLQFSGEWKTLAHSPAGHGEIRESRKQGDSVTTSFAGTGVEYVAQKSEGYGEIEVYLDGRLESKISLGLRNFPTLTGIVVFRKLGLERNHHTLRLVHVGAGPVNIELLRIYS